MSLFFAGVIEVPPQIRTGFNSPKSYGSSTASQFGWLVSGYFDYNFLPTFDPGRFYGIPPLPDEPKWTKISYVFTSLAYLAGLMMYVCPPPPLALEVISIPPLGITLAESYPSPRSLDGNTPHRILHSFFPLTQTYGEFGAIALV